MALITYTLLPSKSKDRKGAKYPRYRINPQNGSKPFFKAFKDIYLYDRANTPDKQRINKENKEKIRLIQRELDSQYKGSQFQTKFSGNISLEKHIEYMIEIKSSLSRSTETSYKNVKKKLIDFCNAKGYNYRMDINKVNLEFVNLFRGYMVTDLKLEGGTSRKYFGLLGTILKEAKKNGKLFHNPFDDKPDYPKETQAEMEYLTPEEVTRMMKGKEYIDNTYPLQGNAFMFMIFSGIRSGDCKTLQWKHLPIKEGQLYIEKLTGKKRVPIAFPLPPIANQYLSKRMGQADYVFPNLRFENEHNKELRLWATKSNVTKHVHPHITRHSFAAYHLGKGTTLFALSKLMGHTNVRTTADKYGHLDQSHTEQAMKNAFNF